VAFEVRSIQSPFRTFNRLKKRYRHPLRLRTEEMEVAPWHSQRPEGLLPLWTQFGIPRLLQKGDRDAAGLEQLVVMDYIADIVEFFSQDTKLCAEQLMAVPSCFEAKYLIVEGLIFKMLALPRPRHHFIFFGKITIELFRKETKRWPRVVGPMINLLFHAMGSLDTEARDRLAEWFSFHLANFNFQWPWENWADAAALPPFEHRAAFVSAVMARCVHLSYYDRFRNTLPKDIVALVPRKPEGAYKFAADDAANALVRMLNQRQSAEDIANHLETHCECPPSARGDSEGAAKPPVPALSELTALSEISECALTESQALFLRRIEMLFVCSLHVGKSSSSHLLSFLKLYGKKPLKQLLALTPSSLGELVVLRSLFEYWAASPVRIEIVADKLHAMNYVTPHSIVKFGFLRENMFVLYQRVYWVLTIQAIDRIVKTTQGMQRGIDKFERDLRDLERNLHSDFNDHDATNSTMRTKQRQRDQLTNRLTQTLDKIHEIFVLFFSECIRCLRLLIAEQEEMRKAAHSTTGGVAVAAEEAAGGGHDDDDEMEMDDDMLMSEQFVVKQETMDREKEKLAVKERAANVHQYIFDIVLGRMVEIARRFHRQIGDGTWKVLEEEVFGDLEEGGQSEQCQRICGAVAQIKQIKQLLS